MLADWMKAEGLDDEALGKKLKPKRSRVTISRYRRGIEDIPTPVIRQLVKLSGGKCSEAELVALGAAA